MEFPITSDGKLLAFTSFGCYPLIYLDKSSNVLCADCATKSLNDPDESFRPVRYDVHWEGVPLYCDRCNAEIESAYGDPGAEEDYPFKNDSHLCGDYEGIDRI